MLSMETIFTEAYSLASQNQCHATAVQ